MLLLRRRGPLLLLLGLQGPLLLLRWRRRRIGRWGLGLLRWSVRRLALLLMLHRCVTMRGLTLLLLLLQRLR